MRRTLFTILLIVILVSWLAFEGGFHFASSIFNPFTPTFDVIINDPYSWSMFGSDPAHSSYSKSIAPDANKLLLWNRTIIPFDNSTALASSPAVLDNKIYLGLSAKGSDGGVYCIDANTGVIIWSNKLGNVSATPALINNWLYVSLEDGNLWSLNSSTGKAMWRLKLGNDSYSPITAVGEVIYAASNNGSLNCISHSTGSLSWDRSINASSSPAIADGKVYVGSSDGEIHCLNAASGAEIWTCTIGGLVKSSPAVVYGLVFAGSDYGNGYCLNASSGILVWSFKTPSSNPVRAQAVAYHRVYVTSDNHVYCLDIDNGNQIWSYDISGNALYPAVADGKVFVNSVNYVYCLDAFSGAEIWRYQSSDELSGSPVVADARLFVASLHGNLVAFSAPHYEALFKESGLASGTEWSVTLTRLDNVTLSSNTDQISFPVTNGQYTYLISPPNGYALDSSANQKGTITVNNANINVSINFVSTSPTPSPTSTSTPTPPTPSPNPTPTSSSNPSPTPTPTPKPQPTPSPTPQPQSKANIQISCQSTTSYLDLKTSINGNLKAEGKGIPNASVQLSYSLNGGTSWNDLTTSKTETDGNFVTSWKPVATGNYLIKATWTGDTIYPEVSAIVNFVVESFEEKDVISVTSNSTILEFSINSINKGLSFSLNGPSGTIGYVNVFVPKSLINEMSNLKVYLDGNPSTYTTESQDESWLVSFTYNHSTHQVKIDFAEASPENTFLGVPYGVWAIAATAIIAALIGIACLMVWLVQRKKPKQ